MATELFSHALTSSSDLVENMRIRYLLADGFLTWRHLLPKKQIQRTRRGGSMFLGAYVCIFVVYMYRVWATICFGARCI